MNTRIHALSAQSLVTMFPEAWICIRQHEVNHRRPMSICIYGSRKLIWNLKMMVPKGYSSSREPSFSGSMLVFGGVWLETIMSAMFHLYQPKLAARQEFI